MNIFYLADNIDYYTNIYNHRQVKNASFLFFSKYSLNSLN